LEFPTDIASLQSLLAVVLPRLTALESAHADLLVAYARLEAENAELRGRLNLNSGNSHKPPSSDGLTKKPAIAAPKGGKSGGQIGHNGNTLKMSAHPDRIIVHHLESCPCCARLFQSSDVERITQRRQVFDIPEPRLEVIEHQIGLIRCCGEAHKGTFPTGVNSLVQYGTKITALSILLSTDYKMPFDKIEQLFSDIYACSFNQSTAVTALEPIETAIKITILATDVVHFDETGMRVEGKLQWFHTSSTILFTYLFVHAKRGKEALNSTFSLIKDFKNWAIHDCWKTYFGFDNCSHALCNAHIVRELDNLIEQKCEWANDMKNFLFQLFEISEKATIIVPHKQVWVKKYQNICKKADEEEPPPIKGKRGKSKSTKGRNLLNRLTEHQEGVLAFAFLEQIPFTNNLAERDIRCLKTKQKVATSFRKIKGAQNYARIQGFIASVRKHKMNVFKQIQNVLDHKKVEFRLD
jgi:transposase